MGMIYKETRARKMTLSVFPRVITIDSSQGDEAPIIFYSVISQADTGRDMGFLTDFWRLNVACTHAADMLLIVGNAAVLDGRLNSDHKIKWLGEDVEPVTETPEILQWRKFEAEPDDDEVNDDEVEDDKINNDKVNEMRSRSKLTPFTMKLKLTLEEETHRNP